jgi:NAD dependent epimerase/dehydratase family enzyme
VNVTAPNPVTNREFTSVVSEVLRKPAMVPVPAIALKMLFGEMAKQTILASQRALPVALSNAGFVFDFPTLRESLQ